MTENKGLIGMLLGTEVEEEAPVVNHSTDLEITEDDVIFEEIEVSSNGPFEGVNLESLLPKITKDTPEIPYNPPMTIEEKIRIIEEEVPEELKSIIPGLEMTEFLVAKEFNENTDIREQLLKEVEARFGDIGYTEENLASETIDKLMEIHQMDSEDMHR